MLVKKKTKAKKIKAFGLGFPNLWFGNQKPIGARPNQRV
jgi:hypothetical protein